MKKLPEFNELTQSIQPLLENYLLDNIIEKRIDQWQKYSYEFRYLDALARIFDIKPKNPCTSVVSLGGKKEEYQIAIAFNSDSNQQNTADLKKVAVLLQQAIVDKGKVAGFMIEVLSKSQCYMYCIGKIQEKLKLYDVEKIDHPFIQETLTNITKFIMLVNSKDITALERYEIALITLGKLLKEDFKDDNKSIQLVKEIFDKKTVETLIRPYQDIQKIITFSQKIGKELITFETINNPEGAHAELAASSYYFVKYSKKSDYIGISKLSCFLCDQVLFQEGEGHRGTHGILYAKDYKLPGKYESSTPTKESLVLKLQSYLDDTIFAKPEKHILETTLLNKGTGKLTQFLKYYAPYNQQVDDKLTQLLYSVHSRGDLDQFDDISFDKGFENEILGLVKENF